MNIENLKKQFERETQKIYEKYATKFYKKGYLLSWSQTYIPIKNDKLYNKVKDRPAIKFTGKKK